MTWQPTIFLRADTRQDLLDALSELMPNERRLAVSGVYALDLIGPITLADAVLDEEGNEITPAVVDDRFHANLRLKEGVELPSEALASVVTPDEPKRNFAL